MKQSRYLYIILPTIILTISLACNFSYDDVFPSIDFFTANATNVAPNGSVTLNWKVSNADEVFIDNGIGMVSKEGSKSITLEESGSYTYTLTAVTSGKRETASVTISCQDPLAASTSMIIDHTCTDPSLIPEEALDLAKTRMLFHYCRYGAHGDQVLIGLDELEIENPLYVSAYSECRFPSEYPALRIMNGFWSIPQVFLRPYPCFSNILPEDYWSIDGFYWFFISLLIKRPHFDASIWMWEDVGIYSHKLINTYTMMLYNIDYFINILIPQMFQIELPQIVFVLSTGPADTANATRYERNKEIQAFCRKFGYWLLDIEDIESWYNGEQYLENGIPTRHPHYADDGSGGGTNADLRRAKAVAFWWLSARLSGWDGT